MNTRIGFLFFFFILKRKQFWTTSQRENFLKFFNIVQLDREMKIPEPQLHPVKQLVSFSPEAILGNPSPLQIHSHLSSLEPPEYAINIK